MGVSFLSCGANFFFFDSQNFEYLTVLSLASMVVILYFAHLRGILDLYL